MNAINCEETYLYSLLISVFIITIVLICLSAHEVYSLFGGLQKTQEEIRLYVTDSIMHCFENDESLEKTNRLIYDFSNDWMNKCRVQTQSEYNEYKKMFMLAFSNLLKHQTKHEFGKLKEYCVKDICIFLKKEQIRGILQGWGRYMGQPCFYLLHTMRED